MTKDKAKLGTLAKRLGLEKAPLDRNGIICFIREILTVYPLIGKWMERPWSIPNLRRAGKTKIGISCYLESHPYRSHSMENFTRLCHANARPALTGKFLSGGDCLVLLGDCLSGMRDLPENSVDSIVCDPPYGLTQGNGKGFMGHAWDASVPSVDIWREAFRVLKPGGHLLAFFGSRTYHRGVVAVEDAGFEIRDQIMWVFATGMPKSLVVSRALGKTGDANSAAASKWEGWATALKPAHEPIVLARKPISEKNVAANVDAHGTGALNIDACRVPTDDKLGGGRLRGPTSMAFTCGGTGWDRPWMNDPETKEMHASRTKEKAIFKK